jgi:DNA-binding beta-propeller fold protein YncE
MLACLALAQSPAAGPYKVVKTAKTGGDGGFDYIYADNDGRKLYIPRTQPGTPRITVFNLDTLAPIGEIPNASARGAATDTKSGHGFVSSKPVVMFDTKTLAVIKTIDVQGGPDGILGDAFSGRIYILSHSAPNITAINAADGTVAGTIDIGGAPEQAATDGKGHIYVDVEDKDNVAVIDTKTMTVTAHYDLGGKGGTPAGLAIDAKNGILFAACRNPAAMVIMNAADGKIITSIPIEGGTDGAGFNANTMEAFSSAGNGTVSIIKENGPASFVAEQVVQTKTGAKTMTIDTKNNLILTMTAEYAAPAPPPPPPPAAPAAPGAAPAAPGPGGPPGGGRGRGGRGPMVPDSFSIIAVGK